MTLYHEIEAECERLADCPDTVENARLGITFRAVWWRQIRQELASYAAENARLKAEMMTEFERGKNVGRLIGWDAAKRDTSKLLGLDDGHQQKTP